MPHTSTSLSPSYKCSRWVRRDAGAGLVVTGTGVGVGRLRALLCVAKSGDVAASLGNSQASMPVAVFAVGCMFGTEHFTVRELRRLPCLLVLCCLLPRTATPWEHFQAVGGGCALTFGPSAPHPPLLCSTAAQHAGDWYRHLHRFVWRCGGACYGLLCSACHNITYTARKWPSLHSPTPACGIPCACRRRDKLLVDRGAAPDGVCRHRVHPPHPGPDTAAGGGCPQGTRRSMPTASRLAAMRCHARSRQGSAKGLVGGGHML
jgi:hypothetical protein